jgi:predicted nucleic acid-binding protein
VGDLSSAITGKLVAFDTAPLIYYLEEHPSYIAVADVLFEAIDRGNVQGITSVLTLLEELVRPLRDGLHDLAYAYRDLLTNAENIKIYPIDAIICEQAARLRARYALLRTPDALQIATAVEHGAEVMLTNDSRWKTLTEIQVVVLKDYTAARQ